MTALGQKRKSSVGQWKQPRTRFHRLLRLGVNRDRAASAAWGGRGPWFSAGTSAMNLAVPNGTLCRLGLVNLFEERQRLARCS